MPRCAKANLLVPLLVWDSWTHWLTCSCISVHLGASSWHITDNIYCPRCLLLIAHWNRFQNSSKELTVALNCAIISPIVSLGGQQPLSAILLSLSLSLKVLTCLSSVLCVLPYPAPAAHPCTSPHSSTSWLHVLVITPVRVMCVCCLL